MDLKECKRKKLIKETKIDFELSKSLVRTSQNKYKTFKNMKLNKITCSSKISLAYDSLRELLEALSIKQGFKIYNHECFCALLKEKLNENKLAHTYNEIRKIRNKINYYGEEISLNKAKIIISDIKNMRKYLLINYF